MNVGIAVRDGEQKNEILSKPINDSVNLEWASNTADLLQLTEADFYIDCSFQGIEVPLSDKPFLVHAPAYTLAQMKAGSKVARFCAWNTFLKREVWEIAIASGTSARWIADLMNLIGWKFLLVKDEPGMISPRIVCGIINEAHFALKAAVSSKEEIDLAMQLGTNYPLGPIEWGRKIGLQQVNDLLQTLAKSNAIYQPAFAI